MFDQHTYHKTLTYLEKHKPKLAAEFKQVINILKQHIDIDDKIIQCSQQIALINQYIYLNENIILQAIRKNELILFVNVLYELLNTGFWHAEKFSASYLKLNYPLLKISDELVSLAKNSLKRIKKSEQLICFCLSQNNADQSLYLIRLFNMLGQYTPGFLMEFYKIVHTKLLNYPWEIFIRWASRGIDLFTSSRIEAGVMFFKIQSRESRQMLNMHHTALADMKNILTIYCSSLAGRTLNILSLEMSGFSMKAVYTDGRSVFLPSLIKFFKKPDLNERVYTALAAHQAAAIKMNTYGFDFSAIKFLADLRERYGTLLPNILDNVKKQYHKAAESIRELSTGEIVVTFPSKRKLLILETDHEKFFYSFPVPDFARDLFNLIENARIEYHLSRIYNGLKEDFELLNKYLYDLRPGVQVIKGDKEEQFFMLLECLIQFSLVRKWKNQQETTDIQKPLSEVIKQFNRIFHKQNTVQDTAETCFRIYNVFFDYFPLTTYCNKNDVHGIFSGLNKPELNPEIILESSPELLREGSQPHTYEPEEKPDEQVIDLASATEQQKTSDGIRRSLVKGNVQLFQYPEYDHTRVSYIQRHCTLFESRLESGNADYYHQVMNKRQQIFKRIKKRFLYLQPEDVEISRHWLDGDDIHLGDAVDFAIDLIRGAAADEKIYFQKIRNRRDIAVAILVDTSSSTDEQVNGQKIINIEKEALCILASALSMIGDTFGIFTFFSRGRQKVIYNVLKDFHESWSTAAQARIPSVSAYASNRDGCAIRHTLARIRDLPEKTKLIVLLSDGIPADIGYGSKSSADTSPYAIEDTRRAIMECRQQGVVPYCITIDKTAKQYIPHLYGNYNYTIIDDVAVLPERLSKLYLRLTR